MQPATYTLEPKIEARKLNVETFRNLNGYQPMPHVAIAKKDRKLSIPHAAIVEAILRCESRCNPAVVEKRLFSIHVRRLPTTEGKGWVVRIIDKEL
jgi:hypothetical protein